MSTNSRKKSLSGRRGDPVPRGASPLTLALRDECARRGWGVVDLGRVLECSPATASKALKGIRPLNTDDIEKLAEHNFRIRVVIDPDTVPAPDPAALRAGGLSRQNIQYLTKNAEAALLVRALLNHHQKIKDRDRVELNRDLFRLFQ